MNQREWEHLRNRNPIEILLDSAALECVDVARGTGSAYCVEPTRSWQTGDFLLGTKSFGRYRREYLSRRQRNDISPAIGNRSAGNPQRVSTARPLKEGVAADQDGRPAAKWKHLDGCSIAPSPRRDPSSVRRDTTQNIDRLLQRFPESRPVRLDTVHKSEGPFRVAEEDFSGWAKERPPALHTGDLPGRRSAVKRRQPEARRSSSVLSFQHDLPAIRGDVVVEHRKPGRQGLRMPGVQVCHPHFPWISVRSNRSRNCLYHPVAKLFAVRRKLRVSGVAFQQRNLALAAPVMNPYGSALQSHGRNKRSSIRRHGDAFLLGQPEGNLLGLAIGKTLPPDVKEASGF